MKPFTSKHCTQYLTKSSPFNQNTDKINDSRKKTVIKRQRSLNEVEIDQNPDNDFSFVPPKYGGIQEVADNNRKAAKRKMSQPTAPKRTPLNQGYITKAMRDKTPEEQRASVRRMIEKREKTMGKPKPDVFVKVKKELANKKIKEIGFKPGSKVDKSTKEKMSSTKYKK